MKRRVSSSDFSNRELKRANSSLFSISTVVSEHGNNNGSAVVDTNLLSHSRSEGVSIDNNGLDLTKPLMEVKEQKNTGGDASEAVSPGTTTPSTTFLTDTEVSSTDGFYIDDDDDENDDDNQFIASSSTTNNAAAFSNQISQGNDVETTAATTITTAASSSLPSDFKTGLVFETGQKHFDRYNRFHKERPLRVTSVRDHLLDSNHEENFKNRCVIVDGNDIKGNGCSDDNDIGRDETCPEREWLEDDDYLRVHLPGYMKRLDRLSNCNCSDRLDREAEQYKSIYFTPNSVDEAKTAATSLCRLVSDVVQNKLDNGFAVIRPPGHHAEPGMAGGYCVINNVAVAAAYAREKLGVKRILIADWDVHHGNGTQSIFLNDPDVLYFSVHRYHGGNFFPFLRTSGPSTVGTGKGTGYNINVGWNSKGMGDSEYLEVWDKILMPIAKEYQPELVLVSAGFDAAHEDMGECNVTPDGFASLTRRLMTLADGKVVCALEGGYVRRVLCNCVESVVRTLLDRNNSNIAMEKPNGSQQSTATTIKRKIMNSAAKSIRETITAHQSYWSCLQDYI